MQLQQKQVTSEAGVSGWCCCRREALERASQETEAEWWVGAVPPERENSEKAEEIRVFQGPWELRRGQ